ncbi:ubiquitin thioesterase OTUB1 isoform X1 [Anolis carolinensis]|uniref:ubiquitin thioesterase OTUB1 isoform X1 n=1 Tax=Anolis carolinensis TaxID=28377 RepID=UPI002F2B7C62
MDAPLVPGRKRASSAANLLAKALYPAQLVMLIRQGWAACTALGAQCRTGGCRPKSCSRGATSALLASLCVSEQMRVNCLAYDEAIMAQQDRIQQEIAVQNPLVSEKMELSVLYKEYADDDHVYQQKIKDLLKKYSYIRKTRPDGNCFYRAFGFSHLEALLEDGKELQRFKEVAAKSKEVLVSQGFTEFTIEDFHNTFMDLIEQVEKQTTVSELLGSFNDQSTSDYLVVYLRLLTSGYLQRENKFFEHFIEGGRSIKEFCQQEVEPMCKESDHIHIIALAQALNVSILVEYMDRGEGGTTNPHVFPEGSEPKVYLLYRPGHYDILYK